MMNMDALKATENLLTILNALTTLATQAVQVSGILQKAQAEGRATLTAAEWDQIKGADDAARKALVAAIEGA